MAGVPIATQAYIDLNSDVLEMLKFVMVVRNLRIAYVITYIRSWPEGVINETPQLEIAAGVNM
jgi:hypothetical protein